MKTSVSHSPGLSKFSPSFITNSPTFIKHTPSFLRPVFPNHKLLEQSISKCGSSSHTAWLEKQFQIFTFEESKQVIGFVGYVIKKNHAVVLGDPLPVSGYESRKIEVSNAFQKFCKQLKLTPIWCCIGSDFMQHLNDNEDYAILEVAKEYIISPANNVLQTKIRQKVTRAKKQGIIISEFKDNQVSSSKNFINEVDILVSAWDKNRKGKQMFTTSLRPFEILSDYRRWFYSRDKNANLTGLLTLTTLDLTAGYYIEYLTIHPEAPQGTSEYLIQSVIETLKSEQVGYLTWGITAADKIRAVNMSGWKIDVASKLYKVVYESFGLEKVGYFRSKFGSLTKEELYVAVQGKDTFGKKAIMAVIKTWAKNE